MTNKEFLVKVKDSFDKYLETGSRSNEKLKILHGAIAQDLKNRLGNNYQVHSLGYGDDREVNMSGRYMDKKVDIAVEKNGEILSAIALKFIMRNYSQNSNNYFENMLGETANIRCNGIPYFQIFIIPDKMPYYDENGNIKKWENFTDTNTRKYEILKKDNPECYFHTPNKMLIYVVQIPDSSEQIVSKKDYIRAYSEQKLLNVKTTPMPYSALRTSQGSIIVFNDYETFADKICHTILAR